MLLLLTHWPNFNCSEQELSWSVTEYVSYYQQLLCIWPSITILLQMIRKRMIQSSTRNSILIILVQFQFQEIKPFNYHICPKKAWSTQVINLPLWHLLLLELLPCTLRSPLLANKRFETKNWTGLKTSKLLCYYSTRSTNSGIYGQI